MVADLEQTLSKEQCTFDKSKSSKICKGIGYTATAGCAYAAAKTAYIGLLYGASVGSIVIGTALFAAPFALIAGIAYYAYNKSKNNYTKNKEKMTQN